MIHQAALRDPALSASRRGGPLSPELESLDREVEAMVDRALGWVVCQIDEFDPFRDGRPFEIRHAQKLAELATMLHGYVELTGDGDSPEVRRVLELVRSAQASRELGDRILRAPAEFVLYCILYGVLRARGEEDPVRREVLQRAVDAGLLEQSERVVHRQMDVSLHLEWGGFRHAWPSLEELCAASILTQDPRPLFLDENAVYAITHVVMFLYGFGLRQTGPAIATEDVREMLAILLVVACQDHHWDLLAELLLCWDCIGFEPTPVYERAWRDLLRTQEEDGAMPGPESALSQPGPALSYFSHHYHTTLVSILAGALRLQRSRARIEARPVRAARRSPEITVVAQRARRWLGGLLETFPARGGGRPDALCQILLGCWICDSILGEEPAFADAARRVGEELSVLEAEGAAIEELPTTLALLATALLASQGIEVSSLEELARILAQVLHDVPAGGDAELVEKRLLLHALGLHGMPEPADGCGALETARGISLAAPRQQVEDLALRIHAWTAYGTRAVDLEPADGWIPEMLVGLATHWLRQYNFMTAGKLLRAASQLGGGGGRAREDCLSFLCLHQRPEGAFGFLGPEEGKLRGKTPEGFAEDLDLYLPVTVHCLWTLAEASGMGWRLYDSLTTPDSARR